MPATGEATPPARRGGLAGLLGIDPERKEEIYLQLARAATLRDAYHWLLILFAAGIATLGLVLNSPAVIIGAMLISPLMGPILAAGLALAAGDLLPWWSSSRCGSTPRECGRAFWTGGAGTRRAPCCGSFSFACRPSNGRSGPAACRYGHRAENRILAAGKAVWREMFVRLPNGEPRSFIEHMTVQEAGGQPELFLRVFTSEPCTEAEKDRYIALVTGGPAPKGSPT